MVIQNSIHSLCCKWSQHHSKKTERMEFDPFAIHIWDFEFAKDRSTAEIQSAMHFHNMVKSTSSKQLHYKCPTIEFYSNNIEICVLMDFDPRAGQDLTVEMNCDIIVENQYFPQLREGVYQNNEQIHTRNSHNRANTTRFS